MIISWKNKGFFILIYLALFFGLILWGSEVLADTIGGIFASRYNRMILYGITCIFAAISTLLTDILTINNGKLEVDKFPMNELYCVSMRHWGYIIFGFGVLNIIVGFLES